MKGFRFSVVSHSRGLESCKAPHKCMQVIVNDCQVVPIPLPLGCHHQATLSPASPMVALAALERAHGSPLPADPPQAACDTPRLEKSPPTPSLAPMNRCACGGLHCRWG